MKKSEIIGIYVDNNYLVEIYPVKQPIETENFDGLGSQKSLEKQFEDII